MYIYWYFSIMIGKFVTKLIQSLPSWEVTKYYGRVCIYQLKCLKYKVQTSEAWFNFKCKFMPGSLRKELECEDPVESDVKSKCNDQKTQQQSCEKAESKSSYKLNDNNNSGTSYQEQCHDEFVPKSKKQGKKNCENNENYSMQDDYASKKQRKVKRAQ